MQFARALLSGLRGFVAGSADHVSPSAPASPAVQASQSREDSAPEPAVGPTLRTSKRSAARSLLSHSVKPSSRYSFVVEMKQADFAPYLEREYKLFDLRITKVDYDRARIRIVRDRRVSIASVPRGASYAPNLFSDGYKYIEGAHML